MQGNIQRGRLREEAGWWDRAGRGQGRPLPARHFFAHEHVRRRLHQALVALDCTSESTVLEVGCGAGEDAVFIRETTQRITGVDASPGAVGQFVSKGFSGVLAEAGSLPFADNSFDFVVASGVLHHLVGQGRIETYLVEFARVARPGRHVVALEPNLLSPSGMLMNIANTIRPGITGLVPHERALAPWRLGRVFRAAGLGEVRCFSASYVWNRFPLAVSRFIASHEDRLRSVLPFSLFGWFMLVQGRKQA